MWQHLLPKAFRPHSAEPLTQGGHGVSTPGLCPGTWAAGGPSCLRGQGSPFTLLPWGSSHVPVPPSGRGHSEVAQMGTQSLTSVQHGAPHVAPEAPSGPARLAPPRAPQRRRWGSVSHPAGGGWSHTCPAPAASHRSPHCTGQMSPWSGFKAGGTAEG